MRKIVVSEFMTLDGVMEDPGDSEGTERGGWAFKFNRGPDGDKFKFDELIASDALLLGRTTLSGICKCVAFENWRIRRQNEGHSQIRSLFNTGKSRMEQFTYN